MSAKVYMKVEGQSHFITYIMKRLSKKQDNILRYADFINENWKDEKKQVKSVKEYVKIREDYIHSFIDEHERGIEPEEEE